MQRPPKRARLPQPTDRYSLGSSGLRVSPICLGMTRPETVRAAFDAGINFFFLSNDLHFLHYLPTMLGLRDLLASGVKRDDIVVAGVSYLCEPMFQHLQFDELLEVAPNLERVDILLAGASHEDNFSARYKTLEGARKSKKWGCTAIGASFHDRLTARMAIRSELLDISYIRYNAAHPGSEEDLFPFLPLERQGLLYNFSSTSGFVREPDFRKLQLGDEYPMPPIQDAYRFALSRPELDGLLVATQTPSEIADLVKALQRGPLPASRIQYMKDIWKLSTGEASLDTE